MRIVDTHHARSLPPRARGGNVRLLVIIFLVVSAALLAGDGAEAMTAVIMAVLAAVTEQLVRAALRYRTRAV